RSIAAGYILECAIHLVKQPFQNGKEQVFFSPEVVERPALARSSPCYNRIQSDCLNTLIKDFDISRPDQLGPPPFSERRIGSSAHVRYTNKDAGALVQDSKVGASPGRGNRARRGCNAALLLAPVAATVEGHDRNFVAFHSIPRRLEWTRA